MPSRDRGRLKQRSWDAVFLLPRKKVALFFEFFRECFYIRNTKIKKLKDYGNNNSNQFQELLYQNPEVS